MSRVRCGLLLAAASLFSSTTAAAVALKLTVTPATSVVGIPPSLSIQIANETGHRVPVQNWFLLHVTPVDGRPDFFASVGPRLEASVNTEFSPLTEDLEPGATALVAMPTTIGLLEPMWFLDPRLSTPGVYRLAVALAEEVKAAGVTESQLLNAGTSSSPVKKLTDAHVFSNEVTFTLSEPEGVDREACSWLAEQLAKSGCPIVAIGLRKDIAEELSKRFPASSYAPYFAAVHRGRSDLDTLIAHFRGAIATVGDHPAGDSYRWHLASLYEQRARTNQERRPDLAALDYEAAAQLLEYLKTHAYLQIFREASARRAICCPP